MSASLFPTAAIVGGFLLAGCGGGEGTSTLPPNEAPAAAELRGDMVMGSPDAPVTIIEYASVTCPVCAAFHEQIMPGLREKYIDPGKARLVFRELPAHNPALSYVGSMVARCAAERGGSEAYFAVVNTLFETQKIWAEGDNPRLELQKVAAQAGMDKSAFDACIGRQDLVDLINDNMREARNKYDISGTPSFVVNGEKIANLWSIEDFGRAIDRAVAKFPDGAPVDR